MTKLKKFYTDYLTPKPTFLNGLISVFDLKGNLIFNESETAEEADSKALYNDWCMVGQDLVDAIEDINEQEQTTKE